MLLSLGTLLGNEEKDYEAEYYTDFANYVPFYDDEKETEMYNDYISSLD